MASPRRRLRFESLDRRSSVDGRCHVCVRLEWRGELQEAEVEALDTQQGRLQAAARATVGAALSGAGAHMDAEADIVGVKAVRAFDGWVVVVRLNATVDDRATQLLGAASCEAEEELTRGAALAVLDATNRLFEKALAVS